MPDMSRYHIATKPMSHARGAWPGTRPMWYKLTDKQTGLSITWHDRCDVPQYKARDAVISAMELLVEALGAQEPIDDVDLTF